MIIIQDINWKCITLLITASCANISIILNQIPIFSALSATALLVSQTNFWASSLISTQLLSRAKRGARGKAATKMVINPNWRTEKNNQGFVLILLVAKSYSFQDTPGIIHHFQLIWSLLPFVFFQYYQDWTRGLNKFEVPYIILLTFFLCHQVFNIGINISWALLIICFPTIITASCWASSIRQPPLPHYS